ncbi:Phage GDSL family lipase [Paucilactobacillus oligofermentans DSM 15707 = LMG 22743]|nr:hypothetical protein [Paucilactobacillus oligofermentans]CUS26142.1 Phage GDSL family lipase [Paucilactobacillus oligofermentans DSM 15707 = LMG 22743]
MVNKLALVRLPDSFTGAQLTDNVFNNCKLVVSKLDELYKLDDSKFSEGTISNEPIPVLNTTMLNRQAYLWLNKQFANLSIIVNELVVQWNIHGVVGVPDYTDTTRITLWLPQKLALNDDFKNNINSNWQIIESKLNDCLLFFNNLFQKGEN